MVTREFNPHANKTANGVLITSGLAVFTNNLDHGYVVADYYDGDPGREQDHWYRVQLDRTYDGRETTGHASMNGERLVTVHPNTRERA